MAIGQVKFFSAGRGYGFLSQDRGAADIFVHISALQGSGAETLLNGQKVTFDLEPDLRGKGPKAVNIRLVSA